MGKRIVYTGAFLLTWYGTLIWNVSLGEPLAVTGLLLVAASGWLGCIITSRFRLAAVAGASPRAVEVLPLLCRRPRWADGRLVAADEDTIARATEYVALLLAMALAAVCGFANIPSVNDDFIVPKPYQGVLHSSLTLIVCLVLLFTTRRTLVQQKRSPLRPPA